MRWHDDIFVMERPFKFQSIPDTEETFPLSPTKLGFCSSDYCAFRKTGASQEVLVSMQETQETQAWSLGQEDPLEKGMAAHASILDWRIPWTEEPDGLQSIGSQKS